MATNDQHKQAFDKLLKSLNRNKIFQDESGGTVISKLGDAPKKVPTISSGSIVLDHALGGGFGKGRVVEVYGKESSGKTTMALTAIGNVQKNGGNAVFIDAEYALDATYAAKLGVDVPNLAVAQPTNAEMIMDLTNQLVNSGVVDIIVIDSVAAMIPQKVLNNGASDLTIGELARLMSREVPKLVKPASENGTTVIFINQLRAGIGMFSPAGTPMVTPGGNALKYYATQRVKVTRTETLKEKSKVIGNKMKFRVEKNKISAPFGEGETVLSFDKGINVAAEIIEVGKNFNNVIHMPNNRTYIQASTGLVLGKSKAEAIEMLEDNPQLLEEVTAEFHAALGEQSLDELNKLARDAQEYIATDEDDEAPANLDVLDDEDAEENDVELEDDADEE